MTNMAAGAGEHKDDRDMQINIYDVNVFVSYLDQELRVIDIEWKYECRIVWRKSFSIGACKWKNISF